MIPWWKVLSGLGAAGAVRALRDADDAPNPRRARSQAVLALLASALWIHSIVLALVSEEVADAERWPLVRTESEAIADDLSSFSIEQQQRGILHYCSHDWSRREEAMLAAPLRTALLANEDIVVDRLLREHEYDALTRLYPKLSRRRAILVHLLSRDELEAVSMLKWAVRFEAQGGGTRVPVEATRHVATYSSRQPRSLWQHTPGQLRHRALADPSSKNRRRAVLELASRGLPVPRGGRLEHDLVGRFALVSRLRELGLSHAVPDDWWDIVELARGHAGDPAATRARAMEIAGQRYVMLCMGASDWCRLSGPWPVDPREAWEPILIPRREQ